MDEFEAQEAARIGHLIRQRRDAQALSQQDLAAELDVSISSIGRWEQGRTFPYPRNRRKLAELLKMSMADLVPRELNLPTIDERLERIETMLGTSRPEGPVTSDADAELPPMPGELPRPSEESSSTDEDQEQGESRQAEG